MIYAIITNLLKNVRVKYFEWKMACIPGTTWKVHSSLNLHTYVHTFEAIKHFEHMA